jgi:phosphoglycolate phosphatase
VSLLLLAESQRGYNDEGFGRIKDNGMQDWLILFDIDGTLLHSDGCGRAATRLALLEVFGTLGALDRIDFAGKTDWQILLETLQPAGFDEQTVQACLDSYNTAATRYLREIVSQFSVRPCPGALEIVAALSADSRVLVGLVTGNSPGLVPIKLRAAGFDPADFKIGAYGSEGRKRSMLPPLALARARAYCGVDFAPEQVVIIGDTPDDIACAASIGARVIAVATGWFSADQLSACYPHHVFENMADWDAVLAILFRSDGL